MVNENSNLNHKTIPHLFSKLFIILLNYTKFLPLTYVFVYIMFSFTVLLVNTTYEQGFFKLVAFTLGIKGSDFELDINDVGKLFFIWWFVFGTLFQIISTLFKKNISRYKWFLIVSAILLIPTIVFGFKASTIIVPTFLYLTALGSLVTYHILSFVAEKFEVALKEV